MSTPTREQFLASSITPATSFPEDTLCSICREDYDLTTHTAVTFSSPTSCNHVFGHDCIVSWLTTHGVNSCPYCRCELFVITWEGSDIGSSYGSEGESDFEFRESIYDSQEERDDEEEEPDDIPLSYLYRDEPLYAPIPVEELMPLLETTWYKTWNLLRTYIAEVEAAYQYSAIPFNPRYFDRYLPTMPMLLGSFLNTIAARVGYDISGLLNERKMQVLEVLLNDMVEIQKAFVIVYWARSGQFVWDNVPLFPRTWVWLSKWVMNLDAAVGILPMAPMSREEGWMYLSTRYQPAAEGYRAAR